MKVEADHGPVRERLDELGAEPLGSVRQHDTYYDHPVWDFAETDETLRLRRESTLRGAGAGSTAVDGSTVATLTYKGPLVDDAAKTREEVETAVEAPGSMDVILGAVGFEAAAEVEKERERFAYDGYVVALDSVAGLGEFVEVEAEGEEGDVEALREGAFDLCRRLGLDPDESIRTSYLALLFETA